MSEDKHTKKIKHTAHPSKPLAYPEKWLLNKKEKRTLMSETNGTVDIFSKIYQQKTDS